MNKWIGDARFGKSQRLPFYPNAGGIYVITNDNDEVLYVGRSKQLCRRASHLTALQKDKTNTTGYSHIKAGHVRKCQENGSVLNVRFLETDDAAKAERDLIGKYAPPWNLR